MAPDGPPGSNRGRIPDGDADAFDDWMARFAELDDAAVDDLLRGDTPAGREDLEPVAALAVAVRTRAIAHGPEIGPALRSQLQERPRVPPRYVGAARRRLRPVTAAAAVLLILGVAATQNALPAAAQRFVSVAADIVGLDVPRPGEDVDQAPATSGDDTGTPSGSADTTPDPEAPDPEAPDPSGGAKVPNDPSMGGAPEETPGGATPADPGTPGDGAPATPAVPPAHSNGGGNGNNGKGDGNGGGRDTAPGQTDGRGASDPG